MRLSVTLTQAQWLWLRRESKRLGISVGEMIRRIIDVVRLPEDSSDLDSR